MWCRTDWVLMGLVREMKKHFHYGSHIDKLIWWHLSQDGLNQEYIYIEQGESSFHRTLISAFNYNNTSKKVCNCPEASTCWAFSPQFPKLYDFHYQTHAVSNLKNCNKTDLNVKNCIFSKNNCRNIWLYQIKVVTLHHQNNKHSNNN